MGKRGNELGQLRKEDAEDALESSSDAPKGPFQKASDDVLKKRRIVRSARKFKKASTPSAGGTGNSVFSSVSLSTTPAPGGGNPFGGFSFGSSTTPAAAAAKPSFSFGSSTTPAPAAAKPAFPAFATPAASAKPAASKPSGAITTSGNATKNNDKIDRLTKSFVQAINSRSKLDTDILQQFISTITAHSDSDPSKAKEKQSEEPKQASNSSWDSSRSLFGGAKPLVSPTGGSEKAPAPAATTNLFGASASSSAAATGGFSFNPTKTGAATAPVPAFSFSTTQSAAVKEAAKVAVASNTARPDEGGGDTNQEEGDNDGELEAADDDYEVIYKTKTKIFRDSTNSYIKGKLKIEKHKENGKYRLVVRDGCGKVLMNSAISKNMPLSKSKVPGNGKKPPTPVVIIKSLFDENSETPETFKIITRPEEHDNLYNELARLV